MKKEEINRLEHMILNNYHEIFKIYMKQINLDAKDFITLSDFAIANDRLLIAEYLKWHLANLSKLDRGNRIKKHSQEEKNE